MFWGSVLEPLVAGLDKSGEFRRLFGGEEPFPEESDHFRDLAGYSFKGVLGLLFIQPGGAGEGLEIPPIEPSLLAVDR